MTPDELQGVIDDTQHTIDRFEATGMNEQMPQWRSGIVMTPWFLHTLRR